MNTLAIVNRFSGKLARGDEWTLVRKRLEEIIGPFDISFTNSPGDATRLTRGALQKGAGRIIAVGGDGTLGEVANGFLSGGSQVNSSAIFSFVMYGTGNDFQKTFGRKAGLEFALEAFKNPREKTIDIGRLEYIGHDGKPAERYFLNVASFGMGGMVDRFVSKIPYRGLIGGKASFLLASAATLASYRNKQVKIVVDGNQVYSGPVRVAVVANCKFSGGGMTFAPMAEPDDGMLDLVIMGDIPVGKSILNIGKIYKGTHLGEDGVSSFRGRRIETFSDEEVLLDVDGEAPGRLPATFEIVPEALKIQY